MSINKEMLINEMQTALTESGNPSNIIGLTAIYKKWFKQKSELRKLLSNHPNWSDDAQAIIFSTDVERPISRDVFMGRLGDFLKFWWGKNAEVTGSVDIDDNTFKVLNSIIQNFGFGSTLDEYQMDSMKSTLAEAGYENLVTEIREGRKSSKILNKIFTELGLPEYFGKIDNGHGRQVNAYDKYFAPLADSINPLTVKRHTLLSINPVDFLLMSNGTGWKSCHNIRDGGYRAGTLSYITDDCSAILYTVDEKYDGTDFWHEPKINRQMYAIKEGTLLASRIYPDPEDSKLQDSFRQTVQQIVAFCRNLDNFWDTSNSFSSCYCTTADGSKHYPDYAYSQYHGKVSLLRSDNHPVLKIGSVPISVVAGDRVTSTDRLIGRKVICAECGEILDRDHARYKNGQYYCASCTTVCSYCGEVIILSKGEHLEQDGEVYCSYCVDTYFKPCSCCGSLHCVDKMYKVDRQSVYVCADCISDENDADEKNGYVRCATCHGVCKEKYSRITKYDNTEHIECFYCQDMWLAN